MFSLELHLAVGTTSDGRGDHHHRAETTDDEDSLQDWHQFLIVIGVVTRDYFQQLEGHWPVCDANAR